MFLQDVSYVHQGCIRSKNKLETIRETVMLWNFKTENTCDAEEAFQLEFYKIEMKIKCYFIFIPILSKQTICFLIFCGFHESLMAKKFKRTFISNKNLL